MHGCSHVNWPHDASLRVRSLKAYRLPTPPLWLLAGSRDPQGSQPPESYQFNQFMWQNEVLSSFHIVVGT